MPLSAAFMVWVYTICPCPFYRTLGVNGLIGKEMFGVLSVMYRHHTCHTSYQNSNNKNIPRNCLFCRGNYFLSKFLQGPENKTPTTPSKINRILQRSLKMKLLRLLQMPFFVSPTATWNDFMALRNAAQSVFDITKCRQNEIPHTIYWKILISIWGMSGCVI